LPGTLATAVVRDHTAFPQVPVELYVPDGPAVLTVALARVTLAESCIFAIGMIVALGQHGCGMAATC
jgi:hypothetical protein